MHKFHCIKIVRFALGLRMVEVTRRDTRQMGLVYFAADDCKYNFKLLQDVCGVPKDSILHRYKEVSLIVCFELCTVLHDDTCSGVLYTRDSRWCFMTKFTIESGQRYDNCTAFPISRFYRRRRCLCKCNS